MKKKLLIVAIALLLVGCGNSVNSNQNTESEQNTTHTQNSETEDTSNSNMETETTTDTQEQTEEETTHTHTYTETVTTKVTCEVDGVKTFTCDCGDSYTEAIKAKGHVFGEYVSNYDATPTADGTETAICVCGKKDTRTVKNSKLSYTYTDINKKMYVNKEVEVRDLPSKYGKKLGDLMYAWEVKVIGQCNETKWYRIEYNGGIGYVSNSYLASEKPSQDINKDGYVETWEEMMYITPEKQACIEAGYGVVVETVSSRTGERMYAILTHNDGCVDGKDGIFVLDDYLAERGLYGSITGCYIDSQKDLYWYTATDIREF